MAVNCFSSLVSQSKSPAPTPGLLLWSQRCQIAEVPATGRQSLALFLHREIFPWYEVPGAMAGRVSMVERRERAAQGMSNRYYLTAIEAGTDNLGYVIICTHVILGPTSTRSN